MSVNALLFVPLVFVTAHAQAGPTCLRATQAMAAGTVPPASGFVAADCGESRPATAMRYDTALRTVRLARALQPGDVVAGIAPGLMADIMPGQALYVVSRVGPVVVQRRVEALQPANPGQRLFVRGGDGKVMSVLYAGGGQ